MEKLIYIIEDDNNIRDLIKIALNSYDYIVKDFDNAEDAMKHIQDDEPILAIFDVMLPGMDGVSAVKKIRTMTKVQEIPILMLTAKDGEVDKVLGLEGGADDYMTKPFSVLELCARVRALIRRSKGKTTNSKTITMGEVIINQETRDVYCKGQLIELTYKEYELLLLLMLNHNQVLEREDLLNKIWGYEGSADTRTIDVHIRHLREKLGDYGEYIRTVRGVGYRFKLSDTKDNEKDTI